MVNNKKAAPPLKKTKGMVAKETAKHSEEVTCILEGYHQKLLLLQFHGSHDLQAISLKPVTHAGIEITKIEFQVW